MSLTSIASPITSHTSSIITPTTSPITSPITSPTISPTTSSTISPTISPTISSTISPITSQIYKTSIGYIKITKSDDRVVKLSIITNTENLKNINDNEVMEEDIDNVMKMKYKIITGTEFQKAVWTYLATIPKGETCTYTEVAQAIGHPNAYRAVANACNANPIPIIIPCHRVVSKKGIGGYEYGLPMKKQLLALEKINN